MAIVIQEKKKGANWFAILLVLFIFGTIGLAGYFLFFVKPAALEVVIPKQLEPVAAISKIKFDPSTVVNSAVFRSLKQYTTLPSIGQIGRDNPFVSF